MIKTLSKRNHSLEKYDELASAPKKKGIDYSNPVESVIVSLEEDDGDSGGVGTAALSVEKLSAICNEAQNEEFNKSRRRYEGQGKFASGPDLSSQKNGNPSCNSGNSLENHPFLSESQQFSGIDPALNPNPPENPEAYKEFQHRLEYKRQLQRSLAASASQNIVPTR